PNELLAGPRCSLGTELHVHQAPPLRLSMLRTSTLSACGSFCLCLMAASSGRIFSCEPHPTRAGVGFRDAHRLQVHTERQSERSVKPGARANIRSTGDVTASELAAFKY